MVNVSKPNLNIH